jgi:hypothetical protein
MGSCTTLHCCGVPQLALGNVAAGTPVTCRKPLPRSSSLYADEKNHFKLNKAAGAGAGDGALNFYMDGHLKYQRMERMYHSGKYVKIGEDVQLKILVQVNNT